MPSTECQFRDDLGEDLTPNSAAGKGKSKKKVSGSASKSKTPEAEDEEADKKNYTGNLCPIPAKLSLDFEDILPAGLQL